MPTSGNAQVWVEDLIGRPGQTSFSPSKSGEIATASRMETFGQDLNEKPLNHGIEVQVEDLVLRTVEVRTLEGRLLYRKTGISHAEMKYDLSQLDPGMYVITSESSRGIRQTKVSFVE